MDLSNSAINNARPISRRIRYGCRREAKFYQGRGEAGERPRLAQCSRRRFRHGHSPSIRRDCSDRSNFGKPLDRVFVPPADGGFPGGRGLRGDVMRAVVETGGVAGQHQVKIGNVDM